MSAFVIAILLLMDRQFDPILQFQALNWDNQETLAFKTLSLKRVYDVL